MAVTFIGAGFQAGASATSPISTLTTSYSLAVGDYLVVLFVYDNSGGGGADPMSGTISVAPATGAVGASVSAQTGLNDPGSASAGLCARCVAFPVTTAIPADTVISVSWSSGSIVRYALAFLKVSSAGITGYRTNSGTGTNQVATAAPVHTTPSINNTEAVLCWCGYEYGSGATISGDADTTNGAWTAVPGPLYGGQSGSALTGVALAFQAKVVTATATQTWNPTAGVASDWILGSLIFTETPIPSITQAAYQFFDDTGTESGAAALAAQNTAVIGNLANGDGYGQIRIRLQSTTAVAVPSTDDFMLQWEKNASGTWNNARELLATYDSTNQDNFISHGQVTSPRDPIVVDFAGNGGTLQRAGFFLQKVGSPTDNYTAVLYAHAGTVGSGAPTGSVLATSAPVNGASISASFAWVYFTFDGTFTLANSTAYFIGLTRTTKVDANYVRFGADSSTPAYAGNTYAAQPAWVWQSTQDAIFEVYSRGAVVEYDSPTLTESAATTNRLTGGTGTFTAGKVSEIGHVTNVGWSGNNYTEILYSVKLIAAQLANGDTLRFRVLRNGSTANMTYSVTPTVNIVAGINEKDRPVAITATVTCADTFTHTPANYGETGRTVAITAMTSSTDQVDRKEPNLAVAIVTVVTSTDVPHFKYIETNRNVDITATIATTDRAGRKELGQAVAVVSATTTIEQADFKEIGGVVSIVSAVTTTDVLIGGAVNYDETGRSVAVVAAVASTDRVNHKEIDLTTTNAVTMVMVTDRVASTELLGGALHDIIFEVTDFLEVSPTLSQEAFRWRNDDGNETTATWLAAQDTNTSLALDTSVRLRVLLDATGDPAPFPPKLYYKKTTDSTWLPVPVEATTNHAWTGATPTAATDTASYNLGTYLSLFSAQTLVGIRIWNPGLVTPQGGGNRQAYLWSATSTSGAGATLLRTIDLPDLLPTGWSEHLFSTPYSGTTGIYYCVGYFVDGGTTAGTSDYGAVTGGLASPVISGPISMDVGRYVVTATPGVIPTSATSAFYGVDILYGGVTTDPVYIATSANITAGGQATTAQLTPPTGKTTAEFSVGRMWDDENGTDSVDI